MCLFTPSKESDYKMQPGEYNEKIENPRKILTDYESAFMAKKKEEEEYL